MTDLSPDLDWCRFEVRHNMQAAAKAKAQYQSSNSKQQLPLWAICKLLLSLMLPLRLSLLKDRPAPLGMCLMSSKPPCPHTHLPRCPAPHSFEVLPTLLPGIAIAQSAT